MVTRNKRLSSKITTMALRELPKEKACARIAIRELAEGVKSAKMLQSASLLRLEI